MPSGRAPSVSHRGIDSGATHEPAAPREARGNRSTPVTRFSRRDLLRISALGSLAYVVDPPAAHAAARSTIPLSVERARHAAFHSLAPGAVEPQGWLRLYLQKQGDQLASQLPQVSWPFTGDYWAGEERSPQGDGAWWPWEQKAYWIDGALRCALALGDESLLKLAARALDYTLGHVEADGYLGPTFAQSVANANSLATEFRWPHTVFFRALAAYSEATGDSRIASVVARHYFADESRIEYGGPLRNVTNVELMLWVYAQTGDERMLAMAEKAWQDFLRSAPPGDAPSGDLHPDRVFSNAPINSHGVTYVEKAKLPAILYMHTGKDEYLRYALAAQERIFSHHMLIDGIPSASEVYRGTTALDAHETCDISDHTWAWGYLLMASGDGVWADRIERACFNAGLGALKKDWKALQYFSCPNQVIATDHSSHVPYIEEAKGWMAYRPNPGENVACCGGNVHRFFPNYVIRMWMADAQGGLAAVLYGASTVQAHVGVRGEPITVHEETDYPFGEEIHFRLDMKKAAAFGLSLRIPAWCSDPRLLLNGSTLARPPIRTGFVRLERVFQPGDRITLRLPMHTQASHWPDNGIGIERGPLVYALPVREQWTPVVTPKWSTAQFPQWNAIPAGPWNYGAGFSPIPGQLRGEVKHKAMTSDPWVDPPVSIAVPMKKIAGWDLQVDNVHPERLQTPPLPTIDAERLRSLENADVEYVTLVPYGATQLRLTIFPKV